MSEFNAASVAEQEEMLGRATVCIQGLELRQDEFCAVESQTTLVAHLLNGQGSIVDGRSVIQAGKGISMGWITLERQGVVWVITHLDP